MLRSTFSRSRSSALPSGCFRNTQVAHTRSNSFTVCPLTASNGWNGPGVLPASNGKRLCHCLSTYLVFLSSEQCATSFFLTIFFVSDQTLHHVMNLGTQMLDWSDASSTWVNHGGASCILLDSAVRCFLHSTSSRFLSKEDILVQDKGLPRHDFGFNS